MARDWESTFSSWAQPPGKTEQQRSENTINAIRKAIDGSPKLRARRIKVFTQGSYRNRVTVRQDSDVDVGAMLYDYFLAQYPEGKANADFGNRDVGYSFSQFKRELEETLVAHFGRAAVTRGNKAFSIRENTYRVEAGRDSVLRVQAVLGKRDLSSRCGSCPGQRVPNRELPRAPSGTTGRRRRSTTRTVCRRTTLQGDGSRVSCVFSRGSSSRWTKPTTTRRSRFPVICWSA